MTGIIGGISIAKFVEIPIPLPPLDEQHRIVAKVDKLMAQCDALENLRNEREKKRLATHAAALSQLTDTTGNRSINDAWAFITQHFGDLYSVKENVAELRKAILELAMRGRLSKSDPSDEPLDALLARLQEEQKANRSIGQKDKELIAKRLAMASCEIKNNRVSLTARDFCEFITKGTTPAADELSEKGDVPFLKVYNIVNNKIDFAYKPSYISSEVHYSKLKRSIVYPGDVIMNIVGPPLGKVAVVDELYPEWNINQALAVFRPMAGILNQYIYYALSTHSVLGSTLREVKGTAGQDNLSLEQCRDLVISIPSIEEQHRIVDSIRQLMALCDTLDQKIDAAKSKQTEMLDALMAQV
jgi:type I restriction enzyme S subunit